MTAIVALDRFVEATAVNHKERVLRAPTQRLERALAFAFRVQGQRFLRAFAGLRGRFAEAALREALTPDEWWRLFEQVIGDTRDQFADPLAQAIQVSLVAGAQNAMAGIGVDVAFGLRNPRAEAYLKDHGVGLISGINEVTKRRIGTIIEEGVREGWSYNRVARAIRQLYTQMAVGRPQEHIESRAHLIAVTEAGNAYEAGSAIVVRDLQDGGLLMKKKWLTVGDNRVSDGCRANQREGWIPFERAHNSGHQRPLRFPGCRCTELYQRRGE